MLSRCARPLFAIEQSLRQVMREIIPTTPLNLMNIRIRLSRKSLSHWLLWRCSLAYHRQQLIRNRGLNIAAFARELGCVQSARG
jgi:hypothetical protein